jgi:hypothetical protein
LGVGFSELRQIALTFCHSIVKGLREQNLRIQIGGAGTYSRSRRSFGA